MIRYCTKVALCDDEPDALQSIASMTREAAAQEEIELELCLYESSTALLEAIQSGTQYHALLLDVMMDGLSGMELAAALRAQQNQTTIVFISSNRDMALCGYEVSAARYLAKPVDMEKLREALNLCYRAGMNEQVVVLPTAQGVRKFPLSKIIYVETWGRNLRLTTTDGQEEVNLRISDLEEMLPQNQFVLCHRTLVVNLEFVRYIRYCELELKTGGVLPVSKYRQNVVREKLFSYLES